uniref:Phosphodiesterase 4D interacting protein n=1 Tax=Rhinopithecus roxellana TaxID=61622 RepID=A0A2K6RFL9_RHIRO
MMCSLHRDYFAEDDGEMVPRTSHTAAFLSDTKDRGPPVQSQIWRSGEKVPFVQTYSLRAFEKPPQVQTQALRDFEKHLNDLKKENFSLKLRIYFLEERMQQKYEASREDIYKRNIELKVEVESLKRELQDKKQHLDKTWADVENLNSQNEAELRRQFEERQQETEHVYELLENKIQLLQEESRLAKNEAARMAALVEAEKECNLELSEKLKGVTKNWEDVPGDQVKPDQYAEALAQRDKRIEELNQSLAAQERLVEQLSQEKQQLLHLLEEPTSMEVQPMTEELLKQQKLNSHETTITQQSVSDSHLAELQEKIQQTEATNKILQEKLNEMSYELKCAQESSQKQDGTIQSLKETLKSRESETEELYQVIEGQNDTMAKLREMLHQSQLGQLHSSEGTSPAQQQVVVLDLQSALFCSQLEIQKLQRVVRQKERQLADAKQCVQFVEAAAHESEQQKEASWKHNQELRKALQQLQEELQNKSQQLHAREAEKYNEIRTQEQNIQHLNHSLSHKEQLLQEFRELLQYRDNSDKTLEANEMLLEKLRQRIHDKAVALERAIDEKFSALEEKEKELRQLRLAVRERDHDLERLRGVLSSNETTMQSMESLLRAKGLEVEQLSTTCQNLRWLKEEIETKFSHWQKEQESIIQQLQTSLHDRNKEVEDLSATLLCKLGPGQSEIAEELCQRLQRKERMLQDLLSDRNKLVVEHEMEIQGLLQSMSTREQESQAAAEKMVQALMERNSELRALRQYLGGRDSLMSQAPISNQQAEVTPTGPPLGEQTDQGSMQIPSRDDISSLAAKEDASIPRSTLGDLDTVAGLEKELSNAKEELELMAKKERESQMELSALQSVMAVQEEELQVQAADMESLTRNIQIKEDLIKDLQMQLVDPEDIPAMERLTQEVLLLREKVASVESQGQEISGNRRQQLLLMLEGLVDERSRLSEALQAERQLYSSLVKFHAHPESSERDRTLQVELEGAQVLRSRLEEVLGRSLERLNRLETLAAIGGAAAGDDTEDASTEFTDSIEEEATHHSHQQVKVLLGTVVRTRPSPQLCVFSCRNTMLSLCLENAELKEQMGEAMSDGWEIEEDKEKGELDNQSQPHDPGPQSAFSLPGSTQHLRSQLSQCKQRYQDLQEKLLLSEATVFAQANELEKYRVILTGESLVKQDSKQVQVDLQDLGYETCGRSENEAEREETTSPECEEHNSLKEMVLMEGLCSEQGRRGSTLAGSSKRKPLENQLGKQEDFRVYGKSENILVLRKDIKDLKAQLQNANKIIQNLKSRVRSLSVTSDYSSSLERPRKLRAVGTLEGSSPHSVPDEDEGWLSDGTGAFYSPGLQAKKDLESLIQRVSQLEAQLPKNGLEGKLAEELRSASWPGKYDSLIQDQARELSYLRQKIREGRGICYLLTQHAKDTVKSFEDLLRSNDIDYYLGQSFREQLAQGSQLTERLTSKLSTKDHKSEKEQAGLEPLALRLSRELQEKEKVIEVLQAKLDARSLTPSSSHALSDSHRSPSSTSFLSDELEACSDMDIASEYTHYEEKKASPGHSDSIHHSSHSAVLSSKPSSTSASQGVKAESSSNPIILPTPQNPPKEANQAHSGASTVPPASTATLPSNDLEASSSHYLNSAQPHSPPRGTIELGRILEPAYLGSSGQWDMMRPQKGSVSGDLSSGSSVYQLNSKPTGADLLEEHLGEIRNLRQRLEESICINDRLREQLEHRLSSAARGSGSTSNFCSQGLESIPQLCNENRVLREENRRLQAQLSHVSREHSQETESLREALLSSQSHLQELEKELEHQKVERQQLLEDLREKQQEVLHFREERLSLQENDSRLQHKLVLLQQQCEEKQQLFESLQSELQIYEALYGNSKKGMKAYSLDACHQIPLSSDLSHLVAEVRALRGQLEQSIQGNNCLRLQLQQQLDSSAGKASLSPSSVNQNFPASADPGNKQLLLQDSAVSPPVRDVAMNSPALVLPSSASSTPGSETAIIHRTNGLGLDTSPVMKTPPKLEGDATDGSFANKHGRHVIGHIDDYSALRQQIAEGRLLVKKIVSLVRSACSFPGLEAQGTEVLGSKGICELRSSTSALHHALEESASLLTVFWRAALPSTHIPVLPGKVEESTERELLELRTKVSKQERLLQSTAERLKTANQQKESMEQFIVSQLTRTHDVLKKARTNLEVRKLLHQSEAPSLSPTHHHPLADIVGNLGLLWPSRRRFGSTCNITGPQ